MATPIVDKVFPVAVPQEQLEPGGHIYTWRRFGLYTHHGIFVGEDTVIHFTRTGVDVAFLDCFRREGGKFHSLHLYAYGQSLLRFMLTRRGTCTILPDTKSPQEVVNKARELHEGGGFGQYHLFHNNCEHFATFCRTGIRRSTQTAWISACERKIKKVKALAFKILRGLSSSDLKTRGDAGSRVNLIVEQA